ncbi:hypothetical protein [Streptomyces acidicola]
MEAVDVEAADVEAADVEAADVEAADVEAADVEAVDVEASDAEGACVVSGEGSREEAVASASRPLRERPNAFRRRERMPMLRNPSREL